MKTIRSQSRVASLVIAAVLLLPIPAALAGAPEGQAAPKKHGKPFEVTFTKWLVSGGPSLAGVTGGDVAGLFAGEVLQAQASTNTDVTPILRLEAIYEVHAFDPYYSFTALIRGGQTVDQGAGLLDGVILSGWRTGSRVHAEYKTLSSCAGDPDGPCFEGTIRIEGDPDE